MATYVALIDGEAGRLGVTFPDLPGCVTMGATEHEALVKAGEALAFHIDGLRRHGLPVPTPRSLDALRQGRPGFAAVDVYEEEPIVGASHPLLHMSNALCTSHLGYAERDSYEALYSLAVDQLLAFAQGKPINVVNPEAVGKR